MTDNNWVIYKNGEKMLVDMKTAMFHNTAQRSTDIHYKALIKKSNKIVCEKVLRIDFESGEVILNYDIMDFDNVILISLVGHDKNGTELYVSDLVKYTDENFEEHTLVISQRDLDKQLYFLKVYPDDGAIHAPYEFSFDEYMLLHVEKIGNQLEELHQSEDK